MTRIFIVLFSAIILTAGQLASQTPPPGFGPAPPPPSEREQPQPERQTRPGQSTPAQTKPVKPRAPKPQPSKPQPAEGITEPQQPAAAGTQGVAAQPAQGAEAAPAVQEGAGPAAVTPAGEAAAAGGAQAETAEAEAAPEAPAPAPASSRQPTGSLNLQNASLTQVIDALCRQLEINYILDPAVQGGVILNTYGDTGNIDAKQLLDLILRINGAAMVQAGDFYRIVPIGAAPRLPIKPEVDPNDFPSDEQIMLSLLFLKYVTVEEIAKVIEPFIGEGAATWAYPPANLLMVMDNRRNMRRTLDLIELFDSDTLTTKRVKLFDVEHRRPSELSVELETVLKSISLAPDTTPIRFLPIDRLNIIVAVAPNPGAFEQLEVWLDKLDQPIKVTAGTIDNYVYRVKYRRAEALAAAIMQLYGGGGYGGAFGSQFGLFTGAASGFGNRYGGGGMGGGIGGGIGGGYGGGIGGGYGGGGLGGDFGGGGMNMRAGPVRMGVGTTNIPMAGVSASNSIPTEGGVPASFSGDATGTYMGAGGMGGGFGRIPMVIPNPLDNSLIIQGTPEEYRQLIKLLDQLDTPPRQVLLDAKIYEVTLTGGFAAGVSSFLRMKGGAGGGPQVPSLNPLGAVSSAGLAFTVGALVDQSRELLSFIELKENATKAKLISAPTLIATDSIPASINVGIEVPVLTAQGVSGGIQSGGSSVFASTVSNRDSGVTMSVLARVNPSGIVTMVIDQEVSAPQPPPVGGIQSPSFSKRTVQTQVTVNDGDTIAIGGIINESQTESSAGVPGLHRIPVLGYAFGSKSKSTERTEMVIFMTPRVIYDTNQITEASDELKGRFRKLEKTLRAMDE